MQQTGTPEGTQPEDGTPDPERTIAVRHIPADRDATGVSGDGAATSNSSD